MKNSPLFPFLHFSLLRRLSGRRKKSDTRSSARQSSPTRPALRHPGPGRSCTQHTWLAPLTLLTLAIVAIVTAQALRESSNNQGGPVEFALQSAGASSKLKVLGDELIPPHRDVAAETIVLPRPTEEPPLSIPSSATPPVPAVPAPLPLLEPPPVLTPTAHPVEASSWQLPSGPATPLLQPGETPMLRNWKFLGLPTLALLAFTTLPAYAGGDRDGPQPDDKFKVLEKQIKDQLDELGKSIKKAFADVARDMDDLRKEVKGNQDKTKLDIETLGGDIDSLKKQIQQMQADIKALKQNPVEAPITNPADRAAMEEIKVRLSKIEAILNELRPGNGNSQSLRPPLTTATFVLVNAYPEEVRFTINGKTYTVPAFSTQVIDNVQPGVFSYTAFAPSWGVFGRNTISLSANEIFTITARP